MTPPADRERFREVLAALAEKTKTKIPELNGRIEKALRLALAGDVDAHVDGRATVYSSSDPTRRYELIEGVCTCRDWEQAPEHLCQHRLAAGFVRKAATMLPQPPPVEPAPAPVGLPEAACSVNCHVMVAGRQVQITLRGTSESEVLRRLEEVLRQYPDLPQHNAKNPRSASGETSDTGHHPDAPQCPTHGALKRSTRGKGWYCPSRNDDGTWCQSKHK
jgi:hypothetical protein